MSCRLCSSNNLYKFLDLGFTPPADSFLRREQLCEPEIYYPLQVMLCESCGFIQLSHIVSPEVLYRHDYPYESSITRSGRQHWNEFALTVTRRFSLTGSDLVIDIGSNVGVLLGAFRDNGCRILGVDPASNIVRIAEKSGIETINEFFGVEVARNIVAEKGPASVITGTNVFAHVNDLTGFMHAVDIVLSARGVLIIEAPYFVNLLKNLEYDTIYHEHLSYLSLKPLAPFFEKFGMEIFDIEERDIHGGSFRIYVARKGARTVSPIVGKMTAAEETMGIYDRGVLQKFASDVADNRQSLLWLLRKLKNEGKRIAAVSAPAKGMTLLNYCHIGTETLDFVTEKSTLKIGRFTPGTHIPVFSDAKLIEEMPDFALLLAWNFADEIMANLEPFRKKGGKFIIPIPTPRIV